MSETKNKLTNQNQQSDEMSTMHYKPNEANINYGGFTLNIDIPKFIDTIKTIKEKRAAKKAMKELERKQEEINDECYEDDK